MTERIAIIGGGLMGHGIALVFACAGHPVRITDPVIEARAQILARIEATLGELGRDSAALANVEVADSLEAGVADAELIAEERLGFKSGRGFRDWPLEAQAALRAKVTNHLKTIFGASRED